MRIWNANHKCHLTLETIIPRTVHFGSQTMGWTSSWDRRTKTISAKEASTNHTKDRKGKGKGKI
jgi:hypothetical protein